MKASKSATLNQRIRSDLESRILSGEWAPGFRIPYEHELMEQYGCSRMTVNKVLTALAESGMIERLTWRGEQPITRVRQMFLGDAWDLVARFSPGAR